MILLSVVLIGCGSGGGGGGGGGGALDSTIEFAIPSIYSVGSQKYDIHTDKTIKFYILPNPSEPYKVDHVFTGTIETTVKDFYKFKFKLPDFLINQERLIYAIIALGDSFDLEDKDSGTLVQAINDGIIIAGKVGEFNQNIPVILRNGATISGFQFIGAVGNGTARDVINFANFYYQGESQIPIPAGREVKFYALTPKNYEDFNGGITPINVVASFTGITGAGNIPCEVHNTSLIGQTFNFIAIIGNFEPQGKKKDDLSQAMQTQGVLLGLSTDSSGQAIAYQLSNGLTIGPFEFMGY